MTTCYINRQSSELYVWMIFRVPEVIHIVCNMDTRDYLICNPKGHGPEGFGHTCQTNL